jgi:hypothetical protein
MEPESRGSSMFKQRSKVDFPDPLLPIIPKIEWEFREKEIGPKEKLLNEPPE